MTVKELSNLFNVSDETIKNAIRELYPDFMQKGKKTNLDKEKCIALGEIIRKKGYIQPTNNLPEPTNNLYVTKDELKIFAKELIKELLPILQQSKQLEIKQDYFSVLGYMALKNIAEARFSEMICFGKEAAKISREMNLPIRKIPDERFGQVNSYHISVLERIFEY